MLYYSNICTKPATPRVERAILVDPLKKTPTRVGYQRTRQGLVTSSHSEGIVWQLL